MMKKIFKWIGIIILILLIPATFIIGNIIGELKNAKPLLNSCMESKDTPFEDYSEVSVERFDDMYRLFYGNKYKFDRIIIPSNITFEDYYDNLKPSGFEYFFTKDNKIIVCGMYK